MVDETKAAAESAGIFNWCVNMTSQMTGEGTEVGLDGPSFDCGKAASTTERTICTEPMLWAQDRAVSSMYGVFTRVTKNQERDTLKESQRSWIAWRERCGGDQACIVQVYNQRLSDFGKSDGWTYRY
jgi:uncharacterized protein